MSALFRVATRERGFFLRWGPVIQEANMPDGTLTENAGTTPRPLPRPTHPRRGRRVHKTSMALVNFWLDAAS